MTIIAGTETTAAFSSGLFNQLLRPNNNHILERLKSEIRQAFATDDDIRYEELHKLQYMTAVIEEGLRMFPSAPIPFVRKVPKGGDTVVGEYIPEGVRIAVSACDEADMIRLLSPFVCGLPPTASATSTILILSCQSAGWTKIMLLTSSGQATPSR